MQRIFFRVRDRADLTALVLCLVAFFSFAILLSYKFFHLGYYDWDLALFAQAMWGLCHGSAQVSLMQSNFLSNHANLIAFLVLPVYKLFPHPLTLVFLKIMSYAVAGYVLYVIARDKLGPATGNVILSTYLIFIPNVLGLFYEFDFESLAPAFLMLLYYFYERDRWRGFMLCAVLLILIKENLPLVVLAFSIHALFTKQDKIRWAVIPGSLAMVSFYLLMFVFIPLMAGRPIGQEHPYYVAQNYGDLGGSLGGVAHTLLFQPMKIWQHLCTPLNVNFLFAIFNPFMYLPLAAPGTLFLISPILMQHLLSAANTEHSICFAYVLTMAPFLFLASVNALEKIYKNWPVVYKFLAASFLILNIFYMVHCFMAIQKRFMLKESMDQTEATVQDEWALIHAVPPEASVVATFAFLAPLSQRKDLYPFYKLYSRHFQNDQYSYQLPVAVQYALIDDQDPWLLNQNDYDAAMVRGRKFLNAKDWVILKKYGKYFLLKRKT